MIDPKSLSNWTPYALAVLKSLLASFFWSMGHRSFWDSPQAKEPSWMP